MWMIVFGFVLGVCIGSFLNVCIDRLPQRQSLVKPPSHCPACGRLLRWFDLFPILSYLQLRGRCRYCGQRIPRRTLVMELGTGLLFAFLGFNYGLSIDFLFVGLFASLFLLLAIIDLEHRLILNGIVYPAIGISLILAPFWSNTDLTRSFIGHNSMMGTFLSSLVGGAIFFLVFLVISLAYREGMGGGDVKMAALTGLAVGLFNVPAALLTAIVGGGLVAGVLLLLGTKRRKDSLPFAPFLSLGAVIALLWGTKIIDWYLNFGGLHHAL